MLQVQQQEQEERKRKKDLKRKRNEVEFVVDEQTMAAMGFGSFGSTKK